MYLLIHTHTNKKPLCIVLYCYDTFTTPRGEGNSGCILIVTSRTNGRIILALNIPDTMNPNFLVSVDFSRMWTFLVSVSLTRVYAPSFY